MVIQDKRTWVVSYILNDKPTAEPYTDYWKAMGRMMQLEAYQMKPSIHEVIKNETTVR